MNDHEIAKIVNILRDIAVEYGESQSLRSRISAYIVPILKQIAMLEKGVHPLKEWVTRQWAHEQIQKEKAKANGLVEGLLKIRNDCDANWCSCSCSEANIVLTKWEKGK